MCYGFYFVHLRWLAGIFCCFWWSYRHAISLSCILSNCFTCNVLLWHSFQICWEDGMLNKENGIFQGWCALTVSRVSMLRVLMYAVFPSCHRGCKAFSPQHSLHFYNRIQDLEKHHKMKPGACDQISVLWFLIMGVCQKHRHPILGWNRWRTLQGEWHTNHFRMNTNRTWSIPHNIGTILVPDEDQFE